MRRILFLLLLLATGAQAQGLWTGWKRSATNATDGVKFSADSLRIQIATNSGLEIVSGVNGIDSIRTTAGAGIGDITSVVAGDGLNGGATSGAATVNFNPKLIGPGQLTITSDSVLVEDNAIDSTKVVNGGLINADIRVSTLDSTRIAPSGITKADLRVSIIDSSRVTDGGLINADIRVSTLDSTRIAPSGITKTDLRVSIIDSSRVSDGGLINADVRVSTLDSTRIINGGIEDLDIRNAAVGATQIAPTAVTAGTYTSPTFTVDGDGRLTAASIVYPPVIFAVDSASSMAGDTTWVWQNWRGVSVTVDSIIVYASSDDYAISIVRRNPNGHLPVLVDAVTASTNGVNTFYQKETTITSATVAAFHWLGFKRPASTGDIVTVRIHYH